MYALKSKPQRNLVLVNISCILCVPELDTSCTGLFYHLCVRDASVKAEIITISLDESRNASAQMPLFYANEQFLMYASSAAKR